MCGVGLCSGRHTGGTCGFQKKYGGEAGLVRPNTGMQIWRPEVRQAGREIDSVIDGQNVSTYVLLVAHEQSSETDMQRYYYSIAMLLLQGTLATRYPLTAGMHSRGWLDYVWHL